MYSPEKFKSAVGNVLRSGKETVDVSVLDGKIVGVLFSANWCPPCRMFKPVLIKAYETLKAAQKPFEVLFVSSDNSESEFEEYYGHQPWLALPYSNRRGKAELSQLFGVQGIPTLVILNTDRSIITTDGRSAVSMDQTGENFPWIPPALDDLIGEIQTVDGSLLPAGSLANKHIALTFTATWCNPCKQIRPKLVDAYKAIKAAHGDAAEFVVVSLDKDEDKHKWDEARPHYPYPTLADFSMKKRGALAQRLGVEGIPSIYVLSPAPERAVITSEGVMALLQDPTGADWPWAPKPVGKLNDPLQAQNLQSMPCLVLLVEYADPAARDRAVREFQETAAEVNAEARVIQFLISDEGTPLSSRLRKIAKLPDPGHPGHTKTCYNGHSLPAASGRRCDFCPKGCTNGCSECNLDICADCLANPPPMPTRHVCEGDQCRLVAPEAPAMLLLDLPDDGSVFLHDGIDIQHSSILAFIQAYRGGSLERIQFE